MSYKKCDFRRSLSGPVFICCLCVLFLAVSGCAPLRKKFTRKKKKDKEESHKFIPVLEPVDYPDKIRSPQEEYKHHYSLWKIWDRDLIQAIEQDGSDKRQRYLLGQSIERLEEMKKLLDGVQQARLAELVDELQGIRQVYQKPPAMRNTFSIKKKIERNARKIRNEFAPNPSLSYRE